MDGEDSSAYLRLSQFLDLESQWLGARDPTELCHRICRTASLLLETPEVAIGIQENGSTYRIVAAEGNWEGAADGDASGRSLARSATSSGTPQLKSIGDGSVGVFPFAINGSRTGCLHVRIERPLFKGTEVSFLRFVASLAAIVLAGGGPAGGSVQASAGEARASDHSARRYVAMAVHDLRNPLNVLSGYAALLDDKTLGPLTDDQREGVAAIRRQIEVLLSVVEQLIDLDGLVNGALPVAPTTFDLSSFFADIARSCFSQHAGRIRWPGPEAAFEFATDRRRASAIVQNLVDNALKHAGTGGKVVVESAREDKQLVIEVIDDGPGLDADLRTALVAHAATGVEPAPRAGLGLFSVASNVHALHGTLKIDCPPAGGTRITIHLPPIDLADTESGAI